MKISVRFWRFRGVWAAGLLAPVVLSLGCFSPPRSVDGLRRDADEQSDFPVPARFDLVDTPREYQPRGIESFRSWGAVYFGKTRPGEVAPFYVSEMPKLGWTLYRIRDENPRVDRRTLVFHKGDEEAVVRLSRKFSYDLGGLGTVIDGHIGPRALESYILRDDSIGGDGGGDGAFGGDGEPGGPAPAARRPFRRAPEGAPRRLDDGVSRGKALPASDTMEISASDGLPGGKALKVSTELTTRDERIPREN